MEEAKKIALKDAGLDEATQKIVFTREELSRNSGKPCYILEFYTAKKQYSYKVDAKDGSIIEAYHFILLADAKKIALDDAGVNVKVVFTTEELVAGGIKTPYYRFVFADAKTQWTYRIDAVLGTVLEKQQKEIVATDFISLEEAKEIALKDAGLDEATQKIVFTREELNRNSGKPCYILEFYTAKKQYSYKVDAKNGSIIEAYHFILLADAKKIALDDAGVSEKVTFTEETLVAGGIKSPYYYFAFESASARWTYKIDAVLGVIMDKTCDKIIPPAPEFIGLEKAKQIALEDAGLDEDSAKNRVHPRGAEPQFRASLATSWSSTRTKCAVFLQGGRQGRQHHGGLPLHSSGGREENRAGRCRASAKKSPLPRKRWLPAASSRPTITSPLKVTLCSLDLQNRRRSGQ